MTSDTVVLESGAALPPAAPGKKEKAVRFHSIKRRKLTVDIVAFALIFLGALVMVIPFLWMIFTSFKFNNQVYVTFLLPKQWRWDTYAKIMTEFGKPGYMRALLNTVLYSIPPIVVGSLVSVLAAYSFSKLRYRGRNILFVVMLSSIMIPFPAIMFPQFAMFSMVGMTKTPWTQILPKLFGNVMMVFFIRQFMFNLPDSLIESAKIDGASHPYIYLRIILPLTTPALFAQGVLWFMGTWNDFLGPLIFIANADWLPLTVLLANYSSSTSIQADIPVLMAGSILSILPLMIIYAFSQKYIIQSFMFSGMKD